MQYGFCINKLVSPVSDHAALIALHALANATPLGHALSDVPGIWMYVAIIYQTNSKIVTAIVVTPYFSLLCRSLVGWCLVGIASFPAQAGRTPVQRDSGYLQSTVDLRCHLSNPVIISHIIQSSRSRPFSFVDGCASSNVSLNMLRSRYVNTL